MSFTALLALAACGQGSTTVVTDPGYDLDGNGIPDDVDTDVTGDETDTAYISARSQSCDFDGSKVNLGSLDEPDGVAYQLTGTESISGFTVDQKELKVGAYKATYSYEIAGFTFTGETRADLADTTDLSADLNTPIDLDGTRLECVFDSQCDHREFITSFEVDGQEIVADHIDVFRAVGPTLYNATDGSDFGCLTDSGFAYSANNQNCDDFTVICEF